MPGTAIGFPSGRFGRCGKMGGMRQIVAEVGASGVGNRTTKSTWDESGPTIGNVDGARATGAHFSSVRNQVKQRWIITGTTKDSTGATLGNCDVDLFTTIDDVVRARTTSDSNGAFTFTVDGNVGTRYIVAYKAGSPDVAGTTVNTLVPVLT